MITLKRNEDIEIFQVELALKSKTKQSPFIAILILAKELSDDEDYYIDSAILQERLLPALPERACSNLLHRLFLQGYFTEVWEFKGKIYTAHTEDVKSINYQTLSEQGESLGYKLTEFGEQSAIDQSFWVGEKGVYNVFVSKSNLIEQRIIRTEKVERAEDNRNTNIIRTPHEIRQYENQILSINKTEVLIEDVEEKCFQLKSANCILEIQSKEHEAVLKLNTNNQTLFQTDIDIQENILQEELLTGCIEFDYDKDKKAILTEFSNENLSFNRKVKIGKPIFKRNQFNQVELENISHIPSDKQNADLWYWELLYKNMNDYFLDENSLKEFASELASPIQLHFKVKVPNRKELAEILNKREDAFYQIAKIETIDYLNY